MEREEEEESICFSLIGIDSIECYYLWVVVGIFKNGV